MHHAPSCDFNHTFAHRHIKKKCNIGRVQGLPYPNLDAYTVIVKAAALIHDEEIVEKNQSKSCNVQVNMRDLQDPEFSEDYEREISYARQCCT
jgi:hypothetical protein